MLNYVVDPEVLAPFVPPGLELDAWEGRTPGQYRGLRIRRCPDPEQVHPLSPGLRGDEPEVLRPPQDSGRLAKRRRLRQGAGSAADCRSSGPPYSTASLTGLCRWSGISGAIPFRPALRATRGARGQRPCGIRGVMTRRGTAWKRRPTPGDTPGIPSRAAKRSSLPTTLTDMVLGAAGLSNTWWSTLRGVTGTRWRRGWIAVRPRCALFTVKRLRRI